MYMYVSHICDSRPDGLILPKMFDIHVHGLVDKPSNLNSANDILLNILEAKPPNFLTATTARTVYMYM